MMLELWQIIADRDHAIAQVERNAGQAFTDQAKAFVIAYLTAHGTASGETLTDACMAAGIVPANGPRAFGAVYMSLSKRGQIVKCGTAVRKKGHLTSGGNLWRISTKD